MIPKKKTGDVNIRISRDTNYRLKATAGKYGITVKNLLSEYSKIKPMWEPATK